MLVERTYRRPGLIPLFLATFPILDMHKELVRLKSFYVFFEAFLSEFPVPFVGMLG